METKLPVRVLGVLSAAALALSACATPVAGPGGNYSRPIGGAPSVSTAGQRATSAAGAMPAAQRCATTADTLLCLLSCLLSFLEIHIGVLTQVVSGMADYVRNYTYTHRPGGPMCASSNLLLWVG